MYTYIIQATLTAVTPTMHQEWDVEWEGFEALISQQLLQKFHLFAYGNTSVEDELLAA